MDTALILLRAYCNQLGEAGHASVVWRVALRALLPCNLLLEDGVPPLLQVFRHGLLHFGFHQISCRHLDP